MKHKIFFIIILLTYVNINAYAGGLLGDAINIIAPGVGTNLDNEHRRIKNNNPGYKNLEENVTEAVKRPFTLACTLPYQTITNAVIARCSNWNNRLDDQHIIQQAKQTLINSNVFTENDFSGVQIRWCPLLGAHGMAPDRGKIYLDVSGKNDTPEKIAALLAHEMKHIQQYRRLGTDNFKCTYSDRYVGCGFCQDRRHSLEREAYDFEDNIYNRLVSNNQPSFTRLNTTYTQPRLSNKCGTYAGMCIINQTAVVGTSCFCGSMYGPVYGNLVP